MNYRRTFKIDRLYNQFLKPRGVHADQLPFLVTKLYEAGFIDLIQSPDVASPETERYAENDKLTSRQHRDELFKLIHGMR